MTHTPADLTTQPSTMKETGSLPLTKVLRALPASVPFVGPEALGRLSGRPIEVRVGANESAFGISPRAREAMLAAVGELCLYNDPENFDLSAALAVHHGIDPGEICISAGVDDLLGLMVRILVEAGAPVVTSRGSYPTFDYHVRGFGGRLEQVPYAGDRVDLQGLLDRVAETGAHLVYVANPDNPMGTWHSGAEVRAFVDALPQWCIAIVDEAYNDFAPAGTALPGAPADCRAVRMRTFSKAHGMAGARVGYAIAPADLVAGLEKVRNHFGVNRVAQAGALASLGDPGFVARVVDQVVAGRREYERLAAELGLAAVPSAANFVCFDIGAPEEARRVLEELLQRGVFVRMPSRPPQSRCIRVTVGTGPQRAAFARALREILEETRR